MRTSRLWVSLVMSGVAAGCAGGSAGSGGAGSATIPNLLPARTAHVASMRIAMPNVRLPLGQTAIVSLDVRDRNGAPIAGRFDRPVALASQHLAIFPAEITNSVEAARVAVSWKPGYGGGATDAIVARCGAVTATAAVTPATGFAYYQVVTSATTASSAFQMVPGPDGRVYFGTSGSTAGSVGRIDPKTGVAEAVTLPSSIIAVFFSADGALWMSGGKSGNLYRLPPGNFAGSALKTIPVPTPNGANYRGLAEDHQHRIWFGDGGGGHILSIPESGPFVPNSIVSHPVPAGPTGTAKIGGNLTGLAFGSDGMLYALDQNNGVVDVFNPATAKATQQALMPQQVPLGSNDSAFPRFITQNAAGTFYFSFVGSVYTYDPGIDTFVPGPNVKISSVPVVTSQGPKNKCFTNLCGTFPDGISGNGTLIYYADLEGAVGLLDTAAKRNRLIPTQSAAEGYLAVTAKNPTNGYHSPNGVAAMNDGSAWFTCFDRTTPLQPLCVGHTVYLNGWSVFPGPKFVLYKGPEFAQVVGIMESPSQDSGPFKVTNSNHNACIVSYLTDHNFVVNGNVPGNCTITVTDAHSVKQSVSVSVQEPPAALSASRLRL